MHPASAPFSSLPLSLSLLLSLTKMKMIMMILLISQALLSHSQPPASSPTRRPDPDNAAVFARWLVREGSCGVLVTLNSTGRPFGNVASYSDVETGTPYFYLSTELDPTGILARADPRACFTVSEAELGCGANDPQSPLCAKITLSGDLAVVDERSREGVDAEAALFRDHPQFGGFPKQSRTFVVFKLRITEIFLVDKPAPAVFLPVSEYFGAAAN